MVGRTACAKNNDLYRPWLWVGRVDQYAACSSVVITNEINALKNNEYCLKYVQFSDVFQAYPNYFRKTWKMKDFTLTTKLWTVLVFVSIARPLTFVSFLTRDFDVNKRTVTTHFLKLVTWNKIWPQNDQLCLFSLFHWSHLCLNYDSL